AISDKNWGEKRVGTRHQGEVHLVNTGNANVSVTSMKLKTLPDQNLRIYDRIRPQEPSDANPVTLLTPESSGQGQGGADPLIAPVEFEPQGMGPFENFVVATYNGGKGPQTIEGKIQGIGVLPVLTGNNVNFCLDGFVEVGKTSQQREFTIRNTGNMRMTVTRIELADPDNELAWADQPSGDVRNDISAGTPLYIDENGGFKTFYLTFSPKTVGSKTTRINVYADTARGTEAAQEAIYTVTTCAYAPGLEFTTIDATNLLCDNPEGTLTITNTGGSVVRVNSIRIEDAVGFPNESQYFAITSPAASTLPVQIMPNEKLDIKVLFTPNTERMYHASVIAETDNGPVPMSIVWNTTRVNAKFTLDNTSKLRLSDKFDVLVKGESATWNQAAIRSFKATLMFNPKEMSYNGSLSKVNLPGDWTVNASTPVPTSDGRMSIDIVGSGVTPIAANSTLVKMEMQTYLSPRQVYNIDLIMSLNDRDKCVITETVGSKVNIEDCFAEGRAVDISGSQFMLMNVSPNPVTNGTIEVHYTVGFASHTRIDLYNAMGELVKVLVDNVVNEGSHSVRIDTGNLSSGVYYCRMVSGPFMDSKSLMITE
ncbi:MAG TPA: T9SS type A sorting domain-containing protein, partial [Patescibacteria group bacterium]|nr:T9SS type A sorting domain-containing protein [Patescibacteria group bacterium]